MVDYALSLSLTCALPAHRQRLVSVQSILSQSRPAQLHYNGSHIKKSPLDQELHQRRLFEYFLVVSLQKSKDQYLPEVTQQFPPKVRKAMNQRLNRKCVGPSQ